MTRRHGPANKLSLADMAPLRLVHPILCFSAPRVGAGIEELIGGGEVMGAAADSEHFLMRRFARLCKADSRHTAARATCVANMAESFIDCPLFVVTKMNYWHTINQARTLNLLC